MSQDTGHLDASVARALLGIKRPFPVTLPEMVRSLKVTFIPGTRLTPRLQTFGERLKKAFRDAGVREVPFQSALTTGERLVEGVVPIYLGDSQFDVLVLGHVPVQNLHGSQSVGIFDRRCPVSKESSLQARLEAIVEVMAANLVSLCIFVTDSSWVMCTMNGSVVTYTNSESLTEDVLHGLVPKLAARVIPPRISDICCRYEEFDTSAPSCQKYLEDFLAGTGTWAEGGLMNAHISLNAVNFKSPLHRLLVTSFQDNRSGMSYGFLAWQLPATCKPAIPLADARKQIANIAWDSGSLHEIDGALYVVVRLRDQPFVIGVPEVAVLCTRSGCEKTRLIPERDIVRMTLSKGNLVLETPKGITQAEDCRPSYDTYTILASALGNCLVASVLATLNRSQTFQAAVRDDGLAFSHWHDYLAESEVPPGYVWHGDENPGVCCSTSQAAIYALNGKLRALSMAIELGLEYRGDVQIEPHHGTNMVGVMSLHETALWVQNVTAGKARE